MLSFLQTLVVIVSAFNKFWRELNVTFTFVYLANQILVLNIIHHMVRFILIWKTFTSLNKPLQTRINRSMSKTGIIFYYPLT